MGSTEKLHTVRSLIEQLQTMPQDAPVLVNEEEFGGSGIGVHQVTLIEIEAGQMAVFIDGNGDE